MPAAKEEMEDLTRLLAEETMLHILKELPVRTLFAAGQVDQRWRRVSRDERLWRDARLGGDQLGCKTRNAVRNIACVLRMAPCLRALSLDSYCYRGNAMLRAVQESQCQIRDLELEYCEKGPWYFELLSRQSGSLVSLSLRDVDRQTLQLLGAMPSLRHLSIEGSSATTFPPAFPKELRLVTLRLSGKDPGSGLAWRLLKGSGLSLQEVSLGVLNMTTFVAVTDFCKALRRLEFDLLDQSGLEIHFLSRLQDFPALSHLTVRIASCYDLRHLQYLPTQIRALRLGMTRGFYHMNMKVGIFRPFLDRLPVMLNLDSLVLGFQSWHLVGANLKAALVAATPPGVDCVFARQV